MLHYLARHFYSPMLLSPILNGTKIQLYFINETTNMAKQEESKGRHNINREIKTLDPVADNTLRFEPSVNLLHKDKGPRLEGTMFQEPVKGKSP